MVAFGTSALFLTKREGFLNEGDYSFKISVLDIPQCSKTIFSETTLFDRNHYDFVKRFDRKHTTFNILLPVKNMRIAGHRYRICNPGAANSKSSLPHIDHEIISIDIFSLLLIQVGQLSVTY